MPLQHTPSKGSTGFLNVIIYTSEWSVLSASVAFSNEDVNIFSDLNSGALSMTLY